MNTFSSLCIGACVFMIFIGFSFGFIGAMGAFPTGPTSPFDPTNSSTPGTIENLSDDIVGGGAMSFDTMWFIGLGIGSGAVIFASILTGTTNLLGVYLFGTFFWGSWVKLVQLFWTFDALTTGAGLILVTMITVGMSIMFIGAVIGMLSGSVSMR